MRSGEWKWWLESSLKSIRNLSYDADSARASGTTTVSAAWTQIFSITTIGKEKKACLSIALNYEPYMDPDVCLLLNFDNTINDETNKLVFEGGDYSFESDSNGNRIIFPDNSYLNSTTASSCLKLNGEFTIEFFVSFGDLSLQTFLMIEPTVGTYTGWTCYFTTTTVAPIELAFAWHGTGTSHPIGEITTDTMYHVAVTRDASNKLNFWLDGVKSADGNFIDEETKSVDQYIEVATPDYYSGIFPANIKMKSLRITNACRYSGESFTPPEYGHFEINSGTHAAALRVLINGEEYEAVDYPSVGRQFFLLDDLNEGDVISAEVSFAGGGDMDWWYTYETSSQGVETSHGLRYPAPEYENNDPRWIGRWTDIYKMLRAAEGDTPGKAKQLESDEDSSDSYSYVSGSTSTLCTVTVTTSAQSVRVECYSRALFTAYELHKDGAKIADLSMFEQRGDEGGYTTYTISHDIVISEVAAGGHTFALKGVATTTETGHMEAQLHVVY